MALKMLLIPPCFAVYRFISVTKQRKSTAWSHYSYKTQNHLLQDLQHLDLIIGKPLPCSQVLIGTRNAGNTYNYRMDSHRQ